MENLIGIVIFIVVGLFGLANKLREESAENKGKPVNVPPPTIKTVRPRPLTPQINKTDAQGVPSLQGLLSSLDDDFNPGQQRAVPTMPQRSSMDPSRPTVMMPSKSAQTISMARWNDDFEENAPRPRWNQQPTPELTPLEQVGEQIVQVLGKKFQEMVPEEMRRTLMGETRPGSSARRPLLKKAKPKQAPAATVPKEGPPAPRPEVHQHPKLEKKAHPHRAWFQDTRDVRNAIVLSEILGPPKGLQ